MPTQPDSSSLIGRWRHFGVHGLQAMGVSGPVALLLSLALDLPFASTLVYSVCITFGCWLFIDGGRLLAARWVNRRCTPEVRAAQGEWPGAGWMVAVLVLGTLAGYVLGTLIAAMLLGHTDPHTAGLDMRSLEVTLFVSMIAGAVATYFFYSRERLAASVDHAEKAERMAAEHRLKLLASQLEPHMLFNTLANLRALIGIDPPRAQAMLDRLIQFLRGTLDASRASTHPLANEFAHLGHYLELMQIRMGARLQARSTLPDELAAHPVPTMVLQPLVENAIKHGLEPHVQGGRIEISAECEGAQLVLKVRDTGAGLKPAAASSGSGFGLEQVRERLTALYGKSASLDLAPAPGPEGGTLATLRLPL
jgi:sensor histidine kinase YesM